MTTKPAEVDASGSQVSIVYLPVDLRPKLDGTIYPLVGIPPTSCQSNA